MSKSVVELKGAHRVEQHVRGGNVYLTVHGRIDGREARVQIECDEWALQYLASSMRAGATEQLKAWQRASEVLGDPK